MNSRTVNFILVRFPSKGTILAISFPFEGKSLYLQKSTDMIDQRLINYMQEELKRTPLEFKRYMYDKIILRKRALVESVNIELKNKAQVEHSKHRSFTNFFTNVLIALAVYCFQPKNPSINLELVDNPCPSLF